VQVVHVTQHTSLDGYRQEIYREVNGVALRVGKLLREAKIFDPGGFNNWVIRDLPFGLETARRLMAISAAYEKLPTEALRDLPRPWQALYALKELPSHQILRDIRDGLISSDMTVEEARTHARRIKAHNRAWRHDANRAAGRLMQNFEPNDVGPTVFAALQEWMDRRI
jgi:hypothetical protein